MLSSIHPLGERARNNRWGVTVSAFTLGAVISGGAVGAGFGWIGTLILGSRRPSSLLITTAIAALAAGTLDLVHVRPPGPKRQVNEHWIGAYRGWVYGGGFGIELGVGFATYIVTWGIFAMYLSAIFTASTIEGALVGAGFGLGRSLTVLVGGMVDRPSRLVTFNRQLARLGPVLRRASAITCVAVGLVVIAMGAL